MEKDAELGAYMPATMTLPQAPGQGLWAGQRSCTLLTLQWPIGWVAAALYGTQCGTCGSLVVVYVCLGRAAHLIIQGMVFTFTHNSKTLRLKSVQWHLARAQARGARRRAPRGASASSGTQELAGSATAPTASSGSHWHCDWQWQSGSVAVVATASLAPDTRLRVGLGASEPWRLGVRSNSATGSASGWHKKASLGPLASLLFLSKRTMQWSLSLA
jgi:hypothetical protein